MIHLSSNKGDWRTFGRISRCAALVCALLLLGISQPVSAQPHGGDAPLRPGDALLVTLAGDSLLREVLYVEADESVVIPRLGRVVVSGVPARELPALVRRALAPVVRGAEALVRPLRRVTVLGEVMKPGVLYLDVATSVRDAVAGAGPFTELADGRSISLVRQGNKTTIRNWQVATGGGQLIASGDVLSVPREGWIRRNAVSMASSLLLVIASFMAVSR